MKRTPEQREAHRLYMQQYLQRRPELYETIRLRAMEWRRQNREKHRAYSTRWKKENPAKVKINNRRYVVKHADQIRECQRRRQKANPAKIVAYTRARQAAQLKRTPAWADHAEILKVYELSAQLTKETGIKHQVDHVIPLRGKLVSGLHVHTNLQVLLARVNQSKNTSFEIT